MDISKSALVCKWKKWERVPGRSRLSLCPTFVLPLPFVWLASQSLQDHLSIPFSFLTSLDIIVILLQEVTWISKCTLAKINVSESLAGWQVVLVAGEHLKWPIYYAVLPWQNKDLSGHLYLQKAWQSSVSSAAMFFSFCSVRFLLPESWCT